MQHKSIFAVLILSIGNGWAAAGQLDLATIICSSFATTLYRQPIYLPIVSLGSWAQSQPRDSFETMDGAATGND
jgi:hypothetical protein